MLALAVSLSLVLFLSLARLRRLDEIHHGYMGIAVAALGFALHCPLAVWGGLLLLLDDDVQHAYEALCAVLGKRVPNDFTPIHRLGEWVIEHW